MQTLQRQEGTCKRLVEMPWLEPWACRIHRFEVLETGRATTAVCWMMALTLTTGLPGSVGPKQLRKSGSHCLAPPVSGSSCRRPSSLATARALAAQPDAPGQ